MNQSTEKIAAGDVQLHVVQRGTGRPILLVHGFPLDHSMWRGQIEALAAVGRVIAPDLRGFGHSDVSPGTVTMAQFADDLAQLLQTLSIHEAVTLCGLSMGGYIAWQFWQRHGAMLERLVLCDTRAAADAPDVARQRLDTAQRVLQEGNGSLADSLLPKLFAPTTGDHQPELLDETRKVILGAPAEGVAAALRGMAEREDFTERLKQIRVPALLVCGQEDAISSVEEMRGITAALPDARLVVVPQAGHMAPLEQPAVVNAALRDFLGLS